MNKTEVKALSLEIWTKLAEKGYSSKELLPDNIYAKISGLRYECPLCVLYFIGAAPCANECPLFQDGQIETHRCYCHSAFMHWASSLEKEARKEYAQEIVNLIEKWEV